MSSIWERRAALEQERREFMRKAMAEFDAGHYQRLRVLQTECAAEGHTWRFTHFGPVGTPWFACTKCLAAEARDA